MTPFYERLPDVGGFGVERTSTSFGAALAAGAAAGVAAHAVATGVHQVRQRGARAAGGREPPPSGGRRPGSELMA